MAPPSHGTPQPAAPIPPQSPGIIVELHEEIAALWKEVQALCSLHEASLTAPLSPHTTPTVVPHTPLSPSTSLSMSIIQVGTAHPAHRWLQAILDHWHCPPPFCSIDSSMIPFYPFDTPEDIQQVLEVIFIADMTQFMGFDSNGDLRVTIWAPQELIVATLIMPKGVPTAPAPSIHRPT